MTKKFSQKLSQGWVWMRRRLCRCWRNGIRSTGNLTGRALINSSGMMRGNSRGGMIIMSSNSDKSSYVSRMQWCYI
nr:hypothetical protein Iba_chr04aCG13600 [Ipomoea batatas]